MTQTKTKSTRRTGVEELRARFIADAGIGAPRETGIGAPLCENLQIRVPVELLQWIDEFRSTLKVVPSRSKTVRYLIERGKAAVISAGVDAKCGG